MIENISFRPWDIDKVIDNIANEYTDLHDIRELPFNQRVLNGLSVQMWKRHLKQKKYIHLTRFSRRDRRLKKHLKTKVQVAKGAIHNVVYLDCFSANMITVTGKYIYFETDTDIEQFTFDWGNIYTTLKGVLPIMVQSGKDEINSKALKAPDKRAFYLYKIDSLRKQPYEYLGKILKAEFIPKLDNKDVLREFQFEMLRIYEIQYLENQIYEFDNPKQISDLESIKTDTSPKLSQKQIALLFQCLCEIGIISNNFNQLDQSDQARLIALMVGIDIGAKPNNWNFYKYWTSIRSTNDDKKVLNKDNIKTVFNIAVKVGFSPLIENLKGKLKDVI